MDGFADRVRGLVGAIPYGRVMAYGQVAGMCGNARSARIVGGIAHYGDPNLPWHRVVNKAGGLASGYPGGRASQRRDLEGEGVTFVEKDGEYYVDMAKFIWWP